MNKNLHPFGDIFNKTAFVTLKTSDIIKFIRPKNKWFLGICDVNGILDFMLKPGNCLTHYSSKFH